MIFALVLLLFYSQDVHKHVAEQERAKCRFILMLKKKPVGMMFWQRCLTHLRFVLCEFGIVEVSRTLVRWNLLMMVTFMTSGYHDYQGTEYETSCQYAPKHSEDAVGSKLKVNSQKIARERLWSHCVEQRIKSWPKSDHQIRSTVDVKTKWPPELKGALYMFLFYINFCIWDICGRLYVVLA